jgi:hypothetical protein
METNQLENIFQSAFNYDKWKEVIKNYFNNVDFYLTPENKKEEKNAHSIAKTIVEFGSAQLADNKIIKFYNVELNEDKHVTKNRVGLRSLIHNEVIPGDVDAILVVFHTKGDSDWRLTFISKAMYWDDDFNENKLETSPRRYTYVLGEDESVKTAVKQFEKLENEQITIKHLIELFNVEKLNIKFFADYKKHYNKFWSYLLDNNKYKKLFPSFDEEKQEKSIRDFTKKLLGRIVFLHFLQKKGWMGCEPHPTEWENGEKQFLLKLLDGFEDKEHFHSKCLTYLFFNTLNAKRENDIFQIEDLNNDLDKTKIPYLNGGLFETDKEVNAKSIDFPFSYFQDLFEFFGQYNFTIDENSPEDHEVGIDPEMLGHIFENLLEDNKNMGAFYTPKEIVQYMTQESLIQYLQTHLGEHYEIEEFIRNHSKGDETAKENFIRDNAKKIEELLDNVKICDPAIGSGAFPMGMLHEIFKAKMALDWTLERSEVKKSIIQNSIYGVDLESGAVDIARLRFWLALVVDENTPQALPNLDYKIMQGNSLLESFEGIDLSQIHEGIAIEIDEKKSIANLFSQELKKKENTDSQEKLEDLIHAYFDLDDPEEKKILHSKIDRQVLNNIYFTLQDHNEDLQKQFKKLNRKIKNKSSLLSFAEQKIKYENESSDAKNLKKLNIILEDVASKQQKLKELYHSNERPFFLWHLMFKKVVDQGGFDIVIGNPPYVDSETMVKNDKEMRNLIKDNFETATGNWDLFIPFVELGFKIAKETSQFCYIIPNKIISAKYTTALRHYLSTKEVLEIRDYSAINVFKEASVYPVTLLVNNNVSNHTVKMSKMETLMIEAYSNIVAEDEFYENISWSKYFFRPNIVSLINRLEGNPRLLDFSSEISILGAATVSEAYLIKEIIEDGESNDDNLKLINTGTIDPFVSLWGIKDTQYIKGKYKYPVVPKEKLIKMNSTRFEQSKKSKLIIAGMAKSFETFFDSKGEYLAGKSTTIILEDKNNLKYILGLLNSKVLTFYLNYVYHSLKMAGGYLNVGNDVLKNCPIINSDDKFLTVIVDYIIFSKTLQLNKEKETIKYEVISQAFEEVIDALVLELYFPSDFKEAKIEILKYSKEIFKEIQNCTDDEKSAIIMEKYQELSEKKNPLRNQIKLMKIELKQLLNPILSV